MEVPQVFALISWNCPGYQQLFFHSSLFYFHFVLCFKNSQREKDSVKSLKFDICF